MMNDVECSLLSEMILKKRQGRANSLPDSVGPTTNIAPTPHTPSTSSSSSMERKGDETSPFSKKFSGGMTANQREFYKRGRYQLDLSDKVGYERPQFSKENVT